MATDRSDVDAQASLWKATVIAVYDFEQAKLGDNCTVSAQTAFDAWRKAEPLLGVAREHLALERVARGQ